MTKTVFMQQVSLLVRKGDPSELRAFAREHLDEIAPQLSADEYDALASGPLEWAEMCASLPASVASRSVGPHT